jgi:EAL domain-containing protein (putative c-di-GMP-specific phosphodiesterase class I)
MFKDITFSHAFQPIFDISENRVCAYEVLLRGANGEGPGSVFSQVEPDDLLAFDQYNRERALILAKKLGIECRIHLNFTPRSVLFEDGRYVTETIEQVQSLGLRPNQLVVEITESEFISDIKSVTKVLNRSRRGQCIIAIDDFGAGYAGLNMLADIQPDVIKLDMTLLRDIDSSGPRQAIVSAINNVGLDLGIDILAEGVESEKEFEFLQSIGIEFYQGYLFAKPGFECLPETSLFNYQAYQNVASISMGR